MEINQRLLSQQKQSSGKSRDFWTGREVEDEDEMNQSTLVQSLQRQLDEESAAHRETKKLLESTQRLNLSPAIRRAAGGVNNEVAGLREKTLDQAEQIEVLLAEIAKLRSENSSNEVLLLIVLTESVINVVLSCFVAIGGR